MNDDPKKDYVRDRMSEIERMVGIADKGATLVQSLEEWVNALVKLIGLAHAQALRVQTEVAEAAAQAKLAAADAKMAGVLAERELH